MSSTPVPQSSPSSRGRGVLLALPVLLVLVVAIIVLTGRGAASPSSTAGSVTAADGSGGAVTVRAVLVDFAIETDVAALPPNAQVTINATNDGRLPHDIVSGDVASRMLVAGESDSITVTTPAGGSMTFLCTVPGHVAAGMTLTLPIGK